MIRKFRAFDPDVINRELASLPQNDFVDLRLAMHRYQEGLEVGYTVKDYGDGLMMIKGGRQGRCLWFHEGEAENGLRILIALLIYKKESQEVPDRILRTARARMNQRKENR